MALEVGKEVDAWCTKCRMDLLHRIVAILEGTPKRVECLTCNTQHNYREPKGIKTPVPKTAKAAKAPAAKKAPRMTKEQTANLAMWEDHVNGKSGGDFTSYSVKELFELDQLVNHKKFGEGFVAQILDDNKICVMFKEGPKTLIHGRG